MKETTPEDWNEYWKKRDVGNIRSYIPRLQQFLLRKFIDKDFVKTAMQYSEKGSIIEIGSGIGLNSITIATERGDDVTLVDFSDEALGGARDIASRNKISINTCKNDIRGKLPFDDKSFTLAWNVGTLEHFKEPVSIVNEMKRISKCVLCIVPMAHPLRLVYEKVRSFFGLGVKGHYVLYTPETLSSVFVGAGFNNVKTKKFIYLFGFISFCGAIGLD